LLNKIKCVVLKMEVNGITMSITCISEADKVLFIGFIHPIMFNNKRSQNDTKWED
jgi:hypothetical protein